MPTINEGRLSFRFPNTWRVSKYDDTNYYRSKMPTDIALASVDFVVSPSPGFTKLILIEVKDFRGYAVENRKRQASGDLVKEVIKKAMDTFAGLYIATYTREAEVSHFFGAGLMPPGEIELILFMEENPVNELSKLELENHKKRVADMEMKLKRIKSKLTIKSRILNTALLKQRDKFRVTNA